MGSWKTVQVDPSSEALSGRGGAACVAIGQHRILVFGGADRAPTALQDFWLLELSNAGGLWTKVSPVVKLSYKRKLLPRSGATLTYLPSPDGGAGKVYIFGGQDPVRGLIFDDLLVLDTSSWELTEVQLDKQAARGSWQCPPARHSHVAGAYEQQGIVVFGGAGLRGPMNDVWMFDTAAASWVCLTADLAEDECPEPREMAAGCMISEAGLLLHGGRGQDGGLLDDICIFDGRAGRWVLVQQTGIPRCAHTACNAAVLPSPVPDGAGTAGVDAAAEAAEAAAAAGSKGNLAAPAAPAAGKGGGRGGKAGAAAPPPASNVLLYGGFTGETVASDLLQLTFLRQQRSSGGHGLRAELRPVKATAPPPPRFAHAAAVLSGPELAQMVVVGGVNQTDDLSDVHIWTVAAELS